MPQLPLLCLQNVPYALPSFLRFLNDGAYVELAIHGENYCSSSFKAYNVLYDNKQDLAISDAIAFFFTIMGILGVTSTVAVCVYFVVLYLPYYQERIESPLALTFVSGIIAFIISAIYLSMIDITTTSTLTCYLDDC